MTRTSNNKVGCNEEPVNERKFIVSHLKLIFKDGQSEDNTSSSAMLRNQNRSFENWMTTMFLFSVFDNVFTAELALFNTTSIEAKK